MSFKKIKPTTLDELTMNVFMLVTEFNPETFNFNAGIAAAEQSIAFLKDGWNKFQVNK